MGGAGAGEAARGAVARVPRPAKLAVVDRLGELYGLLSVIAFAYGGVAVAKARTRSPATAFPATA